MLVFYQNDRKIVIIFEIANFFQYVSKHFFYFSAILIAKFNFLTFYIKNSFFGTHFAIYALK